MRARLRFGWLLAFFGLALDFASAGETRPIALASFVAPASLDRLKATWLFPRGRQVLDGVPFQMDGIIELYGTSPAQQQHPGRTNVTGIPIGQAGQLIHLLVATDDTMAESNIVATVHLEFADRPAAELPIRFGYHVRRWRASLVKAQGALKDPATQIAWSAQHPVAAMQGDYARLFHCTLTNPAPEKIIESISFNSARGRAGLWIAGLSIGPTGGTRLPNTLTAASHLPDERTRQGTPAIIAGTVRTTAGDPLAGVQVRVVGARAIGDSIYAISTDIPEMWRAAATDETGAFSLTELPDNQLYSLQFFRAGQEAHYFHGALSGVGPVEVQLHPAAEGRARPFTARGRVVDPAGQAIAGAMIEFRAVDETGGGGIMFTSGDNVNLPDELVSGPGGEFLLARDKSFAAVQVEIKAPNLVPTKAWLGVSNGVQRIELQTGCTVRGRLLLHGGPLSGAQIGISGQNREASVFPGHFSAPTDRDGRFVFHHLRPGTLWWLYGRMNSLKRDGALRPRAVTTMQNGTEVDVGELEVVPGLRLAGTLRTRTGEALPGGAKLTLGFDQVWDSQTASVDQAGQFAFEGVPAGLIELNFNQQTWRLSPLNRSLDNWNPWQLVGLLEQTYTNLEIIIERGRRDFNYRGSMGNGQLPSGDEPRARPIAGAESSAGPWLAFAGTVVDDATGRPITSFKIVPGRKPPAPAGGPVAKPMLQRITEAFRPKMVPWNELIWWDYVREETLTNGAFAVSFPVLSSSPVLKVEAAGYEPFISEPLLTPTNGLVFRLAKGLGPAGVVLLPDGQPAAGATVVFGAAREQFGLRQTELAAYGNTNWIRRTDADGRFAFAAHETGEQLFAAHTNGWATLTTKNGKAGLKLRLEPWAVVTGWLRQSNGPAMSDVRLHLGWTWDGNHPFINTQLYCVTDSRGRFLFTNVPLGRLTLSRTVPMTGGSWRNQPQTWLEVEPGVTNDLGAVLYDLPPPPSMFEQLKRKVGF